MVTITSSERIFKTSMEIKGYKIHWSDLLDKVSYGEELELRVCNTKEYIVVDSSHIKVFVEDKDVERHRQGLKEMGICPGIDESKIDIGLNYFNSNNKEALRNSGQMFEDDDIIQATIYEIRTWKTKTMSGKG